MLDKIEYINYYFVCNSVEVRQETKKRCVQMRKKKHTIYSHKELATDLTECQQQIVHHR